MPTALIEELRDMLALKVSNDSQRTAQHEMLKALNSALDARRQRIVISESSLGTIKWVGILFQGFCVLVAIAMVHSSDRLACAISLAIFGTGMALSVLFIAAYGRPFTGEISVGPELLQQVVASEPAVGSVREIGSNSAGQPKGTQAHR